MFTIRMDGKQAPGYNVSYVEKVVIFRSRSKENIEKAKEILVWQWDQNAQKVEIGTRCFIKNTEDQSLWDLGEIVEITDEDRKDWPDGWPL